MRVRKLEAETWGERLHRAYRRCRAYSGLVYLDQSDAISQFLPVSDQTLMRFEVRDEPTKVKDRMICFLAIIAYGHDPAEWGLTPENSGLEHWDLAKIRRALDPERRKKATSAGAALPAKKGRRATASSRCTMHHDCGLPQGHAPVSAGQRGKTAA